ncbi:MAG TPA: hypothetical protein VMV43_01655 [Candidatus Nanopelagicaceae bacterium]|nr:hypothetical protein [Candidatus Nanopelagicaceae bacterium]
MSTYRNYRNLEKSLIDYLTAELVTDGWEVRVEKAFSQVYEGTLPCILINVESSNVIRREVGSSSYLENILVSIRLFCLNDGERLDLASWTLSKIMPGISYYAYTITSGVVSEKTLAGRINCLEITANRKELVNLEGLALQDKFRHLLSLRCRVSLS